MIKNGWTALYMAVRNNNSEICQLFRTAGTDVNKANNVSKDYSFIYY